MDEVWAEQLDALSAAGWSPLGSEATESAAQHATLLWREGKTAIVVAQPSDKQTLLSLLPLDAGPGVAKPR